MTTRRGGSRDGNIHEPPRFYLVIVNIQKLSNVRNLMMAAVAFGCREVLLVGQERNITRGGEKNLPPPFREAESQGRVSLRHFAKWRDCVAYLEDESIFLIGVEIDETSQPLNDEYFERHFPTHQVDVAILLGNEGQGIVPQHLKECKALIRIPQYGAGTASLNVSVAASIVLFRFQTWKQNLARKSNIAAVASQSGRTEDDHS
jgi:tRNA G18 (ribose-2'-O)-methylase SpoU